MLDFLLLNPPGREPYLRDYFCSKVSQADYLNHPIDLVCLSGWLSQIGEVDVVDAVVSRTGVRQCLETILEMKPGAVVGLIGSASYPEDVAFYSALKRRLARPLVLIGDVLVERRAERMRELDFADAFLHDFSTGDVVDYFRGEAVEANMTIRQGGSIIVLPLRRNAGVFDLPRPRHDLFLDKPYRYPFVKDRRFATVLTDFGCPYDCNFCIMSTLGWKLRSVENVLQELDFLSSLGVRELFFLDQTFGLQPERTRRLLENMASRKKTFGWVCFARPDRLQEELLELMRAAGCHTLILGLESGSRTILEAASKGCTPEDVEKGFALASRMGFRTVATVLLGLPEETESTFRETMRFLRQTKPDFASFNVAVPRLGTPLRRRTLEMGLIGDRLEHMDQSGRPVSMPTLTLTREQVTALRARAVRDFYGSLDFLGRRLRDLARNGRLAETAIQFRQGAALIRNHLRDSLGGRLEAE